MMVFETYVEADRSLVAGKESLPLFGMIVVFGAVGRLRSVGRNGTGGRGWDV